MIDYYALTDIGSFREMNQDRYYVGTNKDGDFLACVCDGVGGGRAGEVASGKTVEYLQKNFPSSGKFKTILEVKNYAFNLIKQASEFVYDLSFSSPSYYGMGTTITGIYISKYGSFSLNIGDSRTYGINSSDIVCLTDDDSLVNEMIKSGELSLEEAENHPQKHCITKAIGIMDSVEPALKDVSKFDYYMVCSDGVHGLVEEKKIYEVVNGDSSLKDKCEKILSLSLLAGGYDNVTVVLVSCQK